MALYIRDDTVRELARDLARRQGRSVTDAVRGALLDAARRLDQERAGRDVEAREVIEELRAMRPVRIDQDVLYDERGQPRL